MEEHYSPEQVRSFISRAKTERQKAALYLMYNYGMSVEEVLALKKKNFVVAREQITFTFDRTSTGKTKRYKISDAIYFRTFYKILTKLSDDGGHLLHKGKGVGITDNALKKDLFAISVETNKRLSPSSVFDSHLYWSFRKGLNYNHAIEEYGLKLSDRFLKLYEQAMVDGRIIPRLL